MAIGNPRQDCKSEFSGLFRESSERVGLVPFREVEINFLPETRGVWNYLELHGPTLNVEKVSWLANRLLLPCIIFEHQVRWRLNLNSNLMLTETCWTLRKRWTDPSLCHFHRFHSNQNSLLSLPLETVIHFDQSSDLGQIFMFELSGYLQYALLRSTAG